MTAFGENQGAGFVGSAPIAAHVGVGEMPVTDVFTVVDIYNPTDKPLGHSCFDRAEKGGIAEHMGDTQLPARLFRCGNQPAAVRLGDGHGLLQKDMVAQPQRMQGGCGVSAVLGRDKTDVSQFAGGK